MSLTINRSLTTKDGGSVESGAHVVFETLFVKGDFEYHVSLSIYRNKDAFDNGLRELQGVEEIPNQNFTRTLTVNDFANLTPIVMHQHVKEFIENQLGEVDSVSINNYV